MDANVNGPILSIDGLTVSLPLWGDRAEAVSDVSLQVSTNEIFCLVGESGSGKSVIARSILGLLPPKRLVPTAGSVRFLGQDLLKVSEKRLRAIRGKQIGMIFQDPMTALNPLMTIGQQIDELLVEHDGRTKAQRRAQALDMLGSVHMPNPARIYDAYPHEMSGGQRQRAMIALALVLRPKLIIADEPTTALDVTTQAQVLHLIRELQAEQGSSVLFITHDFGVVTELAHRVGVLRYGKMVEQGAARDILTAPRMDYTKELLASVPRFRPRRADPAKALAKSQIEISGLRKAYGRTPALDGIDLSLRRGSTLGVVGESGSGKSTRPRHRPADRRG